MTSSHYCGVLGPQRSGHHWPGQGIFIGDCQKRGTSGTQTTLDWPQLLPTDNQRWDKNRKITIKKYFVTAGGCNSFIGDLWNPSQRGNNFPNFEESNWEFRSSEFGHFLWETVEENILKYLRQSSPYHCLYTQLPDTQSFKSHWKCQFISLIDTLM